MGGRYQPLTPESIAKRIASGRGQGAGLEHQPWDRAPSVPSKGRLVRSLSLITHRVMHMLSEIEGSVQLLADFTRGMVDENEQVLCNFEVTTDIARQIGVRHPRSRQGHLIPMTTDFVLTMENEIGRRVVAVCVKSESELKGRKAVRVLEKISIEKIFHVLKGREFLLVTDGMLSGRILSNLRWLREGFRAGSAQISDEAQAAFEQAFASIPEDGQILVHAVVNRAAKECGMPFSTAVDAFRRAVWSRRIALDLTGWARLNTPLRTTSHPDLGVFLPWNR